MIRPVRAILATALASAAAAPPAAAEPAALRFRGAVASRDGELLTIRREGGSTVTVRMNPKTRVYAAMQGRIRDIKPESYLSVVGGSDASPQRAERVTLYSPSERGFEAGRQDWDTGPGATLTAGWIVDMGWGSPRRVTLAYRGGESAFEIPAGTPVTQISPGERALLVPGAAVTALTHAEPDGVLEAGTVFVGRQGTVPTL